MEVTRLLPSQLTFFHLQQSVVVDQLLGAVLKEARSLAMTAVSSTDERVRKEIEREIDQPNHLRERERERERKREMGLKSNSLDVLFGLFGLGCWVLDIFHFLYPRK